MIARKVFILFIAFKTIFGYLHQKPIHATLTADRCVRNSYRLNDCNWCTCESTIYKCKARVCNEIDMFGHFNDAIQDINVGMEGFGVWRSGLTVCEAGVMYERDDLICVCTTDGNWPNPICRDTFRVLHNVELISSKAVQPIEASKESCVPTKMYVVGCNACHCPETGKIDPELCTKAECTANDPVLQTNTDEKQSTALEVYAECNIDTQYNVGCKKCVCLRNNRLVCDACYDNDNDIRDDTTICANKTTNEHFNIGCNICACDDKGSIYCTTKKCLSNEEKDTIEVSKTTENNLRTSHRPVVDMDCVSGTSYKKNCNLCFCNLLENGKKSVSCTLKFCTETTDLLSSMKSDCIDGTVYKKQCLKCRCDLIDGHKRETCLTDPECKKESNDVKVFDLNVGSLNGYCEPHKSYPWDCNSCRCLPDGETVVCSNKICNTHDKDAVTVDIIPVMQKAGSKCPKDHMYKIGCNVCYCLDNGNALCTTKECNT